MTPELVPKPTLSGSNVVHFFKCRPGRDTTTTSGTNGLEPVFVEEIASATILPWKEKLTNSAPLGATPVLTTSASSSYVGGTYSSVAPFEIEDADHDFGKLLNKIGLDGKVFAVKTLRRMTGIYENANLPPRDETDEEMRKRFYREVDVLRRLNGTVHPHLLTMLTAFAHNDGDLQLCFIFPWAECDLMGYWELGDASWKWDAESFMWMAEQVDGLLGAVEKFHEPVHLNKLDKNERWYGLHADIKSDNILLFRSRKHPRGILVLSDFGSSSFHREATRFNIPNHLVMGAQAYSPPECDIEGGVVSQLYDIWTLGSLFLDMLTWLLGGNKLLEEFRDFVEIEYITGGLRKMFYQIVELPSQTTDSFHIRDCIVNGTKRDKWYKMELNPKTSQWIQLLKAQEGCPGFVRDTLDLIETKMLRLVAAERSEAKCLKRELSTILSRCSSQSGYVFNRKPKPLQRSRLSPSLTNKFLATP